MTSSQSLPIYSLILIIWKHLSRKRKIQLFLLFILVFFSGFAELLSLGAVLPFLAVLSDPVKLWDQSWTQFVATRFDFIHPQQLIFPITVAFASAAVIAALIRLCNLWLSGRLSAAVGSDLSCEAYRRTLYQPYQVHLSRNSSTLISALTQHVALSVLALNSVLQIVSASMVATGLLIGLLLIDWQVALIAASVFSISYCCVAFFSRNHLRSNSKKIAEANKQRVQSLQEGLGAIRDVLLDNTQQSYLSFYQQADKPQRLAEAKNVFLSLFPRYALEALGLVFIATLGGLLVLQRGTESSVIPLLGALALGAQRLLPALQQIYAGWSNLNNCHASLASLTGMLLQPVPEDVSAADPLVFRHSIRLKNVDFCYTSESQPVLKSLNLEIMRGKRIGLIGTTGSGKSTLVDLIMGLLIPTNGSLSVDGVDLHDPNHSNILLGWRSSVAHVPQTIYLSDSSIAENIAFGVPKSQINMTRVMYAAAQAQISSFIESMPEGYDTFVGERGIRLSGGQRQRIGIARALYKRASVIILDEATSALDILTERAVMESVEGLSRDLTMIIIAHRLSTLQRCEKIFRIENGIISEEPKHDLFTG